MNVIVSVIVTQTVAPAPSKLQRTGALLSQGGTTTAPGTKTLITQPADFTAVKRVPLAITSLAWAANVVTVTTAAPHGFTNPSTLQVTIAGAAPVAYNGSFLGTVTGASTFTYPLVGDPGMETVPGTYITTNTANLQAMVNSFFAQGTAQAVYVLELGPGVASAGVTYLSTWLAANPGVFYSYCVPTAWSDEATFITLCNTLVAPTAKTYFYVTMTTGNYGTFGPTLKCVKGMIQAPAAPSTELSIAAWMQADLALNPSATNKVPPTAFKFLFSVTAYPDAGNSALFAQLKAAGVNIVGTGAEGNISNTCLFWGTTMDLRDASYWYSVDWVQINGQVNIAAAVINGSNDPVNPLYLNQEGINRLQQVLVSLMKSAVTFGMALGQVTQTELDATTFQTAIDDEAFAGQIVINAVPFTSYYGVSPSDYSIGKYGGLSIGYTPARGFTQIVFNLNVEDIPTQ